MVGLAYDNDEDEIEVLFITNLINWKIYFRVSTPN